MLTKKLQHLSVNFEQNMEEKANIKISYMTLL